MEFEVKRLHAGAIPGALEKAEHYRLLNEAREAESICLDILDIDPENQKALVTMLLALTDQFERNRVRSRRSPTDMTASVHAAGGVSPTPCRFGGGDRRALGAKISTLRTMPAAQPIGPKNRCFLATSQVLNRDGQANSSGQKLDLEA